MEIISAKYLLPMTKDCPIENQRAIAIELDQIVDIDKKETLINRYPNSQIRDYPNSVIMPGLINAHCHLDLVNYSCQQTEEFEPKSLPNELIDNLIEAIQYKQDAKIEEVLEGVKRGALRLIETGVTSVGEVTHFEGSFNVLDELGMRGVVFSEVLAGHATKVQENFEVALALADRHMTTSDARIQVGLGPYSSYTLSRQLLKVIGQHAKQASIPIQIHAAESFAEMEFFFDSQGPIANFLFPMLGWKEMPPEQRKTPVQYLHDIGFLDAPVTIVGGLHLSKSDFPLLARNLSHVVYCPTYNEHMKLGTLPYGKLVEAGIPIGIGTECWNGRLGFNMWEELRCALMTGSNPIPAPVDLIKMATIGGARVLELDHITGTIEKGKKADIIVVNIPKIEDEQHLYASLIEQTQPHHVELVMVDGKILK